MIKGSVLVYVGVDDSLSGIIISEKCSKMFHK